MNSYNPGQVLNGTFGELWLDGEYMAEVTAVEAKSTLKKTEVPQVRKLTPGQKVTGAENKGTMKLNHVTSYMKQKIGSSIKEGKTPTFTAITSLSDPDAIGGQTERIKYTGVVFDEVALTDFENGKLGEESYSFTYDDFEFLDVINPEA